MGLGVSQGPQGARVSGFMVFGLGQGLGSLVLTF